MNYDIKHSLSYYCIGALFFFIFYLFFALAFFFQFIYLTAMHHIQPVSAEGNK